MKQREVKQYISKQQARCLQHKPIPWIVTALDAEPSSIELLTTEEDQQRRIGYLTALSDIWNFIGSKN